MINDIFDISDNTPLVLMKQLSRQKRARFVAKLEYMNPCFSHYCRVSAAIVRDVVPAAVAAPLTDVVFARPYCRIGDVVAAGIAQRQRASDHLKALVRAGVLEEHRAHRDRIFLNRALIEALGAPVLRQDR